MLLYVVLVMVLLVYSDGVYVRTVLFGSCGRFC